MKEIFTFLPLLDCIWWQDACTNNITPFGNTINLHILSQEVGFAVALDASPHGGSVFSNLDVKANANSFLSGFLSSVVAIVVNTCKIK